MFHYPTLTAVFPSTSSGFTMVHHSSWAYWIVPSQQPVPVYQLDYQMSAPQYVYYAPQPYAIGYQQYYAQPSCYYSTEEYQAAGSREESYPSSFGSESTAPFQYKGTTYYTMPDRYHSTSSLPSNGFSRSQLHSLVSYYKASMTELMDNGYPMYENGQNKLVTFKATKFTKGKKMFVMPEDKMRRCCRCHIEFELEKIGTRSQRECVFHPRMRLCCGEEDGMTTGCEMRSHHVFDQIPNTELEKFVRTEKSKGKKDERSRAIYAIDAEMVYTIHGPALARLSVVDWEGRLVLDVLVKPPTKVIDPNTEFSGLTMADINSATDTLESCRQKLFKLVNEQTILVGHSLESDLKALRLVHTNVVDTSLLYLSGGYKVGLKKLALKHLGINIQSNNPEMLGHDSQEDARVSLDLLKLRMEMCN